MIDETLYCVKCKQDRLNISPGVYACGKCGETTYGFVQEFIPNIWLHQKPKHSRRRWFSKLAQKYVGNLNDEATLTDDFLMVVHILEKHQLLKTRNVSAYKYYLIRLASRRNIKLIKPLKDIMSKKTIDEYDQRLFGKIYPLLNNISGTSGWNIGTFTNAQATCGHKCKYYANWKKYNYHKKNILDVLLKT